MSAPTTNFSNRTLADMRTLVYGKIRRKSTDPLTGLSTSFLNDYIATWDAYFCDYTKWTFRRTQKIITIPQPTTLSAALATTDLTFSLTSGTYATATGGRVSINQDEIDYSSASGVTATISTVSGAKTPNVSHTSGSMVNFLIPAPADFGRPGEVRIGDAANPGGTKLIHVDNRMQYYPVFPYYFFNDGYLYFPSTVTASRAQLNYFKKAMKVTNDSDNLQTPRKYDDFVLWAAMAECYEVMGDEAKADLYYTKAGISNPTNANPSGILQLAAAMDSEQTDSYDEVFVPA